MLYNILYNILYIYHIEIYSADNERRSVVVEKVIRSLKENIYKCITPVSKNLDVDKLDNIFNKYKNKYHDKVNIKPADVKISIDIDFGIKSKVKNLNFRLVNM